MDYAAFIAAKTQYGSPAGFDPVWLPNYLKDFQRHLCEWAIRVGRCAIFAGCGMGKTPMQLVFAENVVRKTNRPVLILTPLAVAHQFTEEAVKFHVDAVRSKDGTFPAGARVVIANYERLHYFKPNDFAAVLCDEGSILKNMDGVTRAAVTEFMRTIPYRLIATATPSPNDYVELGTAAEALGAMGQRDMLTMFFRQATTKDHLGWGRTKYVMRSYAERDFWRWCCSWSRAIRKPSDLGFDDGEFILPPLNITEHKVDSRLPQPGRLFSVPAFTLEEQREERRRTIPERCEKTAELATRARAARPDPDAPDDFDADDPLRSRESMRKAFEAAWNAAGLMTLDRLNRGLWTRLEGLMLDPDWRKVWRDALARAGQCPILATGAGGKRGPMDPRQFLGDVDFAHSILRGMFDPRTPAKPSAAPPVTDPFAAIIAREEAKGVSCEQ